MEIAVLFFKQSQTNVFSADQQNLDLEFFWDSTFKT